jgi:hypothetical protein
LAELEDRLQELYSSRRIVGLANADAANLVPLLNDADVKFRFFVGELILRNAKGAFDALLIAASDDSEEIRRSSVHLLGKIARNIDGAQSTKVGDTLTTALKDEDPKVRRNAAIALGDLQQTGRVNALADALGVEPFDWVRPSMILALGMIGGADSASVLEALVPKTGEESEALAKARDRVSVVVSDTRKQRTSLGGREVELHCAPGQEAVLCDSFEAVLGQRPKMVQNGSVRTPLDALCDLHQVRSWREWLVCIDDRSLADRSDGCCEQAGLELLLAGLDVCNALYSDAPLSRYRIELKGKEVSHASRRKLIKQWVSALTKQRPHFANSPSHYEVELRLQRAKTKVGLFLKLTEEPDARFDYRQSDVPAAMHPATAAGIVQMAKRKRERGRVLDPFCGCGTLLFERSRSGIPFGELVGSDISGNAVEAAKANLDHSGEKGLTFRRGDVRSVRLEGRFDELISNLPYGIRTGSHEKNIDTYQALFDRLPEWMNDGASITLVTQEIDLMQSLFDQSRQVRLLKLHRVDTGGLQPGVFVGVYKA